MFLANWKASKSSKKTTGEMKLWQDVTPDMMPEQETNVDNDQFFVTLYDIALDLKPWTNSLKR